VFSLRSPARPNPIALAIVKILGIDQKKGIISIDAIDCLDGTPVLDIKPYLKSIDGVEE
jgi:tRNA (Thr-GGU) A37 N-methylase